jgi:cobalt/nickel transport system permease protein
VTSGRRNTILAVVAVLVVVATGVVLSQFASDQPDGLEYVAQQEGFDATAQDHDLSDAPLADYGENLATDGWVATAIAAVVGLAATAVITVGMLWLVRSRKQEPSATP